MTAIVITPELALQDWSEICRQRLNSEALFLGTETTGLDERAEVVELSVVNAKGEPLIDTLVRPASPIPYQVTKVHGITNELVADAPTWWDIHEEVSALLCGRTIIAYNARFDSRMIGQTCGIYRLPPIPANWFCAMRMYQKYSGNYKWVKLFKAATECGITLPDQAHRALPDTLMCLGIVREVTREDAAVI